MSWVIFPWLSHVSQGIAWGGDTGDLCPQKIRRVFPKFKSGGTLEIGENDPQARPNRPSLKSSRDFESLLGVEETVLATDSREHVADVLKACAEVRVLDVGIDLPA